MKCSEPLLNQFILVRKIKNSPWVKQVPSANEINFLRKLGMRYAASGYSWSLHLDCAVRGDSAKLRSETWADYKLLLINLLFAWSKSDFWSNLANPVLVWHAKIMNLSQGRLCAADKMPSTWWQPTSCSCGILLATSFAWRAAHHRSHFCRPYGSWVRNYDQALAPI